MFKRTLLGLVEPIIQNNEQKKVHYKNKKSYKKDITTDSQRCVLKSKVVNLDCYERSKSEIQSFSTTSKCNQGMQLKLRGFNVPINEGYIKLTFEFLADGTKDSVIDYLILQMDYQNGYPLIAATTQDPDDVYNTFVRSIDPPTAAFTNFSGYRKSILEEYLNATSRFGKYSIDFETENRRISSINFNIPSSNRFIQCKTSIQLFKKLSSTAKIYIKQIDFLQVKKVEPKFIFPGQLQFTRSVVHDEKTSSDCDSLCSSKYKSSFFAFKKSPKDNCICYEVQNVPKKSWKTFTTTAFRKGK